MIVRQEDLPVATGSYALNGVEVVFGIEVSPEGFSFRFKGRDGHWLIASARIFIQ